MQEQGAARENQSIETQLIEYVRKVADEVHDPCSMAMGLHIGLAEMGLVREIVTEAGPNGWHVLIRLRVTSPGCQYFFYFQQELERRLLAHPDVVEVKVEWDEVLDWTPEDLAMSARQKLEARRRLLIHPVPVN